MFISLRKNVQIKIDSYRQILWLKIGSENQVHYSYETVCDISETIGDISALIVREGLRYVVMISANKLVWNMGGDLELFESCIRNRSNIHLIRQYAYNCINVVDSINKSFFNEDVIVISAIQGNAFGGGFECALAGNYIIAEKQVKFRFPEVLFGSFPGMGAYSFLTRRVGFAIAEQMIRSGKKWSAEELLASGIVNAVCDRGGALNTTLEKIESGEFKKPDQFGRNTNYVPKSELLSIVNIWLEEILSLNNNDMYAMQRIIMTQRNVTKTNQ